MKHCTRPVSYTHLDVYKRQPEANINVTEYFTNDSVWAVSYTHLDVYKRQESNGYDRTIVSKLLHKTQNKQQTKTENNKFITLTYINKQTEKISHKFKKAGYRIAYKTTNKTEHTLSIRMPKAQNKFDLPGVYNCLLYTSRCV